MTRTWLRDSRVKNGLSQAELAKKLGISESYYSFIESGDRQKNMDLTLATKLSIFLNLETLRIVENEIEWRKLAGVDNG